MSILLIDLSSLVHPLFHMSGSEPDPDWTSTQAIAKVHALASRFDHVAVCVDSPKSFRKAIAPSYKANRPERDGVLIHQLRVTEDKLRADGFPIWKFDGYEADDIIASAANALCQQAPVTIATSDKDLYQLVCDGFVTGLSFRDGSTFDEAAVLGKFGVRPDQIRDYLTLVGDSSDNITGVKGIGPKTAAALLQQFGTLDSLLEAMSLPDKHNTLGLKPSVAKALTESIDAIAVARQLITLSTDAEIDFSTIFNPRTIQTSEGTDSMSEPLTTPTANPAEPVVAEPQATVSDAPAPSVVTTSIEPYVGAWARQLEPTSTDDVRTVAKWIHESRLFAQYGSPQAVFSIVLAGRELGLGVMASLRGFFVVEGKPMMAADLIRALVLSSGKAEYFTCVERTADSATWETKRRGDPTSVKLSYSMAEAEAAGIVRAGSAWMKQKPDMIAKTASTKLARLVYPDVTFGIYSPSEVGEVE